MKEIISTITSKGQVTIPAEVRNYLGLKTNPVYYEHLTYMLLLNWISATPSSLPRWSKKTHISFTHMTRALIARTELLDRSRKFLLKNTPPHRNSTSHQCALHAKPLGPL